MHAKLHHVYDFSLLSLLYHLIVSWKRIYYASIALTFPLSPSFPFPCATHDFLDSVYSTRL
jgi:hypothetical protein